MFIRGADRSGGFLEFKPEEGDDVAELTEQLASITNQETFGGNHGWFELATFLELDNGFLVEEVAEPLEANAPLPTANDPQTTGAPLDFSSFSVVDRFGTSKGTRSINDYDAVVFGSNNAQGYSSGQIDLVENFIRGGGGALFISDANFGSSFTDAPASDQQFLDRFGIVVNEDRGTFSRDRADGEFLVPGSPLFDDVDSFDGEGVSPFTIVQSDLEAGVDATILAGVPSNQSIRPLGGGSRPSTLEDASLFSATVDDGRLVGHFDRNTFFNINGAGTNINRLDNEQLALNIFSFLVPEPSAIAMLGLGSLVFLRRRNA
ncbi:MAG: PEP-CTERM sorting domain-containing protein [Planctomycetota bacterium]